MAPSDDRARFLARYASIFEYSPWIAEEAFDRGSAQQCDTAEALHQAMFRVIREAPAERQLALINVHPDLAGKLALADALTDDSRIEQSSAGLDRLSPDELARFTDLNNAYKARFGFVFIMAVRGKTKADILAAFEERLTHDPDREFRTALDEIAKISRMRLDALFASSNGSSS